MSGRLLAIGRVVAILSCAFLVGGASTEVAVRTHAAVKEVERERELGSAGELVALRLTTSDGSLVAQPRIIAPAGKPARLLLHPPGRPDEILLSFRVETERQSGGLILLRYELSLPDRSLLTQGRLKLAPGVKQAVALPKGELVATWMAVPVPSDAFEDYLRLLASRQG